MTPARSLAASVVALGFAGALTAPQPALAAPAICERPENFAAQSGAELFRINKLEVRAKVTERPRTKNETTKNENSPVHDAANRVLSGEPDPAIPDPADSDTPSEGIGMIGTGALGYLGVLPKRAPAPTGDADVVPTGNDGLGGVAERGGAIVNGLTGRSDATDTGSPGAGGGEPADNGSSKQTDDERTGNRGKQTDDERTGSGGDRTGSDDRDGDDRDRGDRTGGGQQDSDGDGDGDGDAVDDEAPAGGGKADRRVKDDARTLSAAISDVGAGQARTATIGTARLASAAYARMLDGYPGDKGSATHAALVKPLIQQAPPTNAKASGRSTPAGKAGPLRLGDGRLTTHAQWDAGMACGRVAGETGRAHAELSGASILTGGRGPLVRVPGVMTSQGVTGIENRDGVPRTVARSTVTAERIELFGGKVRLRVLRAPTLEATMSATSGGQVSYRPAIVEVSGEGIATKRLEAAGENLDVSLPPGRHTMESAPLRNLTELDELQKAAPLPVPPIPGLPPLAGHEPESVPVPGAGAKLRVSLGDVRQAVKGHAIAARASAVKISLTQPAGSKHRGKGGYADKSGVSLSMSLGLLEAAAVSPESPELTPAGAGGGLPVTGSDVVRVVVAGGALLLAGVVAVMFGLRRRRSRL
ncbi:hypothetical protein [Actinoplanes solisilvae]|uniref:hypothetical protein n=1 Tax=Actinoplanes solisilvae TaxID=2486853 RepID=UPI000FDC1D7A|nr:hypothetical protein [Actinoplanes solisilvae]